MCFAPRVVKIGRGEGRAFSRCFVRRARAESVNGVNEVNFIVILLLLLFERLHNINRLLPHTKLDRYTFYLYFGRSANM